MDVSSLHLPLSDDLPRSDSAAETDPPPPERSDPESETDSSNEDDEGGLSSLWPLAHSLASFEYAIVKMKDKSRVGCLRIYGEIKLETRYGYPPYLYRRTEFEADTIPYSPSDDGFVLPLSFPDWSLSDGDIYECDVQLYEAGPGGSGTPLFSNTFCLYTRGDDVAVKEWEKKIYDEPISLVIDYDRATFTMFITRICCSVNACFIFRVVNSADDSDYKGKLLAHGTITATQTLSNGVSRTLTLFDSSSGVEVPPKRPYPEIPLITLGRPIIVFPVRSEEQVKAGDGPFVTVDFGLNLREDGSGDQDQMNRVLKGTLDFHLDPDHGLGYPIFSSIEETTCSDQGGDNQLKIEIVVCPFHECFRDDPIHSTLLLNWGLERSVNQIDYDSDGLQDCEADEVQNSHKAQSAG